jgi:uncharacterized damage-inducible protein DinB
LEEEMGLSESLLPEFDHEMANTRKTLERVPDGKFDWKPHEKSSKMGNLAGHLANLPSWGALAISSDSFDMAPGGKPVKTPEVSSTKDVIAKFDENVAATRAAIAGAKDEEFFRPWALLSNGKTILSMPKVAVLRSFVISHIIHHRAQLGVYLRLNDIPVPSIYGPSADESSF